MLGIKLPLFFIVINWESAMELAKDMVAASATPLILSILNKGDSYGYDIIGKVKELSKGQLQWADGMLYPIMHRLEKKQLVEAYWGKSPTGRKRKYYKILPLGQKELAIQLDQWQTLNDMLQQSTKEKLCSI